MNRYVNQLERRDQIERRQFLTKAAQATVGAAASVGLGAAVAPLMTLASETSRSPASRISYCCNGEIFVNEPGKPEGEPLTTGYTDFKPSWSKTNDMLICFRRTKDDPVTANWKSAIFVIKIGR